MKLNVLQSAPLLRASESTACGLMIAPAACHGRPPMVGRSRPVARGPGRHRSLWPMASVALLRALRGDAWLRAKSFPRRGGGT